MNLLIRASLLLCLVISLLLGWCPTPAIAQTSTADSICYMQTSSGLVIDLGNLCAQSSPSEASPQSQAAPNPASSPNSPSFTGQGGTEYPNSNAPVSYVTPPTVYDYQAMREFDRELYGN
jgi:hypothetical protein